jgi:hypothetical protein
MHITNAEAHRRRARRTKGPKKEAVTVPSEKLGRLYVGGHHMRTKNLQTRVSKRLVM